MWPCLAAVGQNFANTGAPVRAIKPIDEKLADAASR